MKQFILIVFLVGSLFSCKNGDKKQDKNSIEFINSLKENKIGNSGLTVSLPANYTVREKGGEDFRVYYLMPADTTILPAYAGGIYIGAAPSEFTPSGTNCKTDSLRSKLLDGDPQWKKFSCDSSYFIQTIITHKDSRMHAFGKGKTESDLKKVLDIFSTLK